MKQRDKVMREQGKVLKVREELIALLNEKEQYEDGQITTYQRVINERDKVTMLLSCVLILYS